MPCSCAVLFLNTDIQIIVIYSIYCISVAILEPGVCVCMYVRTYIKCDCVCRISLF